MSAMSVRLPTAWWKAREKERGRERERERTREREREGDREKEREREDVNRRNIREQHAWWDINKIKSTSMFLRPRPLSWSHSNSMGASPFWPFQSLQDQQLRCRKQPLWIQASPELVQQHQYQNASSLIFRQQENTERGCSELNLSPSNWNDMQHPELTKFT